MSTNWATYTQSAFYSACEACLDGGNQWFGDTGSNTYLASCEPSGTATGNGQFSVSGSSSQASKMCSEAICFTFDQSTCASGTNIQGTKYNCEWSNTLNICTLNMWDMVKAWVIPLIIIVLLCCCGGCFFVCRRRRVTQPKVQETIIIEESSSRTPYAQMENVNSQI